MSRPSRIISCRTCGTKNRVPAVATGTPRCGACRGPIAWIADVGDDDWADAVEAATLPVVVDFWAEWCGPCRSVAPILERIADEFAGRIKLVKVDVDASPELARRFEVQGIPMMAIVDHGQLLDRRTGAAPEHELARWIEATLARS